MYKTLLNTSSAEEQSFIDKITAAVIEKQKKNHKKGKKAQRDVHTKSHGTFKATFTVRSALPSQLKVGLFAKTGKYNALVRFSNGAFASDAFDALPNIRGIAIKLLGVSGGKMLPGEENSTELDFLMANDETFFAPRIEDMFNLVTGNMKGIATDNPRVLGLMLKAMMKVVKNPLHTDYYSQVPYAFGPDRACKFALLAGEKSPCYSVPNLLDRHYLRHGAVDVLKKREVTFTFAVQLQQSQPLLESLEDSSMLWTGDYLPVADLTFHMVDRMVEESEGEELSFNPWRTLLELQPLSWAGRVRRAVYAADFKWRTEENRKAGLLGK